jgi:hypothetical protein
MEVEVSISGIELNEQSVARNRWASLDELIRGALMTFDEKHNQSYGIKKRMFRKGSAVSYWLTSNSFRACGRDFMKITHDGNRLNFENSSRLAMLVGKVKYSVEAESLVALETLDLMDVFESLTGFTCTSNAFSSTRDWLFAAIIAEFKI